MDKTPWGGRLPSGGGAVGGIGSDFSTNLNTGVGSYAVPIPLPGGFRGQAPQLALQYSSGAGADAFGLGWSLGSLAVRRDDRNGVPAYDATDVLLLGGEPLVDVGGGVWRPQVDASAQRVRRWGPGFEVTDRMGTRFLLGTTGQAQERRPDGAVLAWLVERIEDTSDNVTTYTYLRDGDRLYPKAIEYAGYRFEIEYAPRPDPRTVRRGGFAQRTALRATRLGLHRPALAPSLVRAYDLGYVEDPVAGHSLLASVTLTGFLPGEDGAPDQTETASPLRFTYAPFAPQDRRITTLTGDDGPPPPNPSTELVDLEGFGLPGMLEATPASHRYWANRGDGTWAPPRRLTRFPGVGLDDGRVLVTDVDGDARPDLVVSADGWYPGTSGGWGDRVGGRSGLALDVRDPRVRVVDATGDGRADLLRATDRALLLVTGGGDGWTGPPSVVPRRRDDPTSPDVTFDDPRVRLADMTGDGLLDVVRLWAGAVEIWPGTGPMRFDARVVRPLPGAAPARFDPARCHLADVNGDGLTDVVYTGDDAILVWINRGESFGEAITLAAPPPVAPGSVRVADMLGTTTAGLLFGLRTGPGRRDAWRFLDLTGGVKPYLLTGVDNGVGKVTAIAYGSSSAHRVRDRDEGSDWDTFLPRAVQVVDRVTHRDTVTGREATTEFRYHRGHFDARSQRFAGFAEVESTERYGDGTAAVATLSGFHLGLPGEAVGVPAGRASALRGQLARRETRGPDGTPAADRPFLVEATEWDVIVSATGTTGTEILMPLPRERRVERWERSANPAVTTTRLTHDAWGNVVAELRTGHADGQDDLAVESVAEYVNDTDRWMLGLLVRKTQRVPGGARLSDVRTYYDGLSYGQVHDGLLSRRERLAFTHAQLVVAFAGISLPDIPALGYRLVATPDGGEWWCDEYTAEHDPRGNLTTVQDGSSAQTTVTYDADGLRPVKAVNPLGHTFTATYHPRLDTIATYTEPNGATTAFRYSPLGRVVAELHPGDTEPSVTFAYRPPTATRPLSTVMERRRDGAAPRRSVTYYDGRGNELQTRARQDDGSFFVTGRTVVDLRGLAVEAHPAFVSAIESYDPTEGPTQARRAAYDALQRTVMTADAAGNTARAAFTPTSITFYDALDNDPGSPFADTPRAQDVDAWGRLVAVREHTGGSAAVVTTYSYDPRGLLTAVTDAAGPLLTQVYDAAGRLMRIDHRDAGSRRFLRDARGRIVLYADGNGSTVGWKFDALGRTVAVATGGATVERHTYDTGEGANLLGRLAKVEDETGNQIYSYDPRGRLVRTARTVDGKTFAFGYEYDADDRRTAVQHPDGARTEYGYDALGRPYSVSGLLTAVHYDTEGRRARAEYAGGEVESRAYDPLTGRLVGHAIADAGGNVLLTQAMTYDAVGNVLTVADPDAPTAYRYDALNRLVRAHGGPPSDPYDHTFGYDAIGNLVRDDAWRPDEIRYAGARLTGAGTDTFSHDANGCLVARPGMTLEYDAREMLRRVRRDDGVTVEFAYDHRSRRLRKRVTDADGVRDTLYIGESFEVTPDGHKVRYVSDPGGGATLVVRDGIPLRTLFTDRLGHVAAVRAAGSGLSTPVRYTAYGSVRTPVGADIGEILYAGRRFDAETGLVHLRMRYYDPVLGRFLTPDPIAVTDADSCKIRPLSLNPYAYALDNPLRFTDPNGLWTFWEGFLTVVVAALVVAATALTFGAAGVVALGIGAAVGAIIGGATTGSVDGALAGAMLGFSVVATVLAGVWLGAAIGGIFAVGPAGLGIGAFVGVASAALQAMAFIPSVRQNEQYRDMLGYASWFNPWAWPGHIIGAVIFVINAVAYTIAYAATGGHPGEKWDMQVDFDHGMVVTTGGWIRPPRAFTFGNFITLNPNDPAVQDPTSRDLILRHERGHALNNVLFGVLQAGRIGSGTEEDSFWEQLAESNVNPYNPSATGDKDTRREQGGRGFGDIPWWTPGK